MVIPEMAKMIHGLKICAVVATLHVELAVPGPAPFFDRKLHL